MESIISDAFSKTLDKVTQQLVEFLTEQGNFKKNPKTAGLIYVGTGTLAIAVAHKQNLQKQALDTCNTLGVNVAEVPQNLLEDPAGFALYKSILKTMADINQSAISVLAWDITKFLNQKPTLRQELTQGLVNFKAAEALSLAKKQPAIEKANELSASRLARFSSDSELEPSSSVISKVPTILEKFLFEI